jgi:hypothetical protein
VTCEATSGGGTNTYTVFLQRDATPPTLAPSRSPGRVLLDGPINVAAHADDATSGVGVQRCSASTHVAGAVAAKCTARDVAGNTAKATVHYTVEYVLTPIKVSGAKAGAELGLAIRITDAHGQRIPDRAADRLGCQVSFRLSGAQARHGCLTYHKAHDQFRAATTLGNKKGAATLRVRVTYPGSSVKTTVKKAITIKG